MRILNLLGVSVLLALAACDDGTTDGKDDTTDTDGEDTDDDTPEPTDTAGGTGGGGPSGPWNIAYFSYFAQFAVDESGAVTSVTGSDGSTFAPVLQVFLLSEDYFYGSDDEACVILYDISSAMSIPAIGSNYASWEVDLSTAPAETDCDGFGQMYGGYSPTELWSYGMFNFSIGPFNSTQFSEDYFPGYSETFGGGEFQDNIFTDQDGNFLLVPSLTVAVPLTADGGYDATTTIPPDEIPQGTGVTPALYQMDAVFGYGPIF